MRLNLTVIIVIVCLLAFLGYLGYHIYDMIVKVPTATPQEILTGLLSVNVMMPVVAFFAISAMFRFCVLFSNTVSTTLNNHSHDLQTGVSTTIATIDSRLTRVEDDAKDVKNSVMELRVQLADRATTDTQSLSDIRISVSGVRNVVDVCSNLKDSVENQFTRQSGILASLEEKLHGAVQLSARMDTLSTDMKQLTAQHESLQSSLTEVLARPSNNGQTDTIADA